MSWAKDYANWFWPFLSKHCNAQQARSGLCSGGRNIELESEYYVLVSNELGAIYYTDSILYTTFIASNKYHRTLYI